jgi:hypothetical protein
VTSDATRLPNFLVIGAMKAGTTSLYHYLRSHPQVFMPQTKEVNFFNPMRNWRKGLDWYRSQFAGVGEDVIAIGEASTSYTKFPWVEGAPERIASTLGADVRLIYVVRHPVERMRSQYLHNLTTGQETRSIEDAFSGEPMYLNISRYAMQLERYDHHFARDRLMIVDSRDLRDDRENAVRRVFEFLDVDASWIPPTLDQEFLRSDGRPVKPPVLRALRRVPRVRTLAVYVPDPIKRSKHRLAKRLASTEELQTGRGEISDELRARLADDLREDVLRFREYMDAAFDGWDIA